MKEIWNKRASSIHYQRSNQIYSEQQNQVHHKIDVYAKKFQM
jgi:hypothetical protein